MNAKQLLILLGLVLGLFFISGWQAQDAAADELTPEQLAELENRRGIDIDVRGGARRVLVPLAIPDTLEPGGDTRGAAATVQDTLRRTIDLSGFFKVLPPDGFFFDPSAEGMAPADINFQNWFNVGAQGLIKSAARVQGDRIILDLRLYQVDQGQQVRLKYTPEPVSRDQLANEVYKFVNALIEYYTGEPGIFGTRILYVAQERGGSKQIYSISMDGSSATRITNNNAINILPSWGPRGSVMYTGYAHDNPDLWIWDGKEHRKLSSYRGLNSGAQYCNGRIALTLSMGGENADIYLIDADTGQLLQRLTEHWAIDTSPTWSPGCNQIAFISARSGTPQIYVMNADGSGKRRITFQGSYNTTPIWSPKGDVIVFTARDERNRFDIFTVNLEGNIERLTQDQGNNEEPSFSPDGRYIVFSSDRGGRGKRLWIMTSDGEIQKLLTTTGSGYTSPSWGR